MADMHTPLKPCPMCGEHPAVHTQPANGTMRIVCWSCGTSSGWVSSAHGGDPSEAWNRRAPSDSDGYIDQLNVLCADFGCIAGSDRLHWLHDRLSQDAEKIKALREALVRLIYETTHLSPIESDGSHHCYISSDALSAARAALAGSAS